MTFMTAISIIVETIFPKFYKGGMIIDSTDTTLIKIHSGTIYIKKNFSSSVKAVCFA